MTFSAYTTNLCRNSSFEVDTSWWTPVLGAVLSQSSQDAVAGQYSMLVSTPGIHVGEGVYGPQAVVDTTCTGSVSASFSGPTGTIIISAVNALAGGDTNDILAQQTLVLNGLWQRVTLNNLAISATDEIYILVQTTGSAQELSFLMDAVQYEPESPAHDYIDGSFPGCTWSGTPFETYSWQQGQFSIALTGGVHSSGSIEVTLAGEAFNLSLPAGEITSGGSIVTTTGSPVAAFDDFALYQLTDADPAMTYAGWNTASLLSGKASYTRPWGIFYPPVDYPVSDGSLLWSRAAFMGMGMEFIGVAQGAAQNITAAQVEMVPLAGPSGLDFTPAPQAFDTPRALHLNVKPARLNYSTNPNFDISLAGWTAVNGATVARDTAQSYGVFGGFDGVPYRGGTSSMRVTAASASSGVTLVIPQLIAGDTYTASVYVQPSAGMTDLLLQACGVTGGVPGADGVATLLAQFPGKYPVQGWVRARVTFVAAASTVTLSVSPVSGTYPAVFWLAANMIEAGEVAGIYFDGSMGSPDFLWEGTPGLSRSYYYPNYKATQTVVADILASHTPFSITAAAPTFLQPPTQ